jgi:hypothetical protein
MDNGHMKALTQFGFLRVTSRQEDAVEDGRVLTLFRKRAELKKAYSDLQDEVHRLKDRIKQQEGATARVQEMLAALESRLGVVETGYPALVFYQLRALWQLGREVIEQFVADLVRQQDERERRLHVAEWNRKQFARRQSAMNVLRSTESKVAEAQQNVAELVSYRESLTRFWHYFKRREVDARLHRARVAAMTADGLCAEARAGADAIEQEETPAFPGLSLDARRAINLAAIAYAEVLCLRLADTPLVTLAKEATSRREPTEEYGTRQHCEALIAQIARARTLVQAKASVAQDVKTRTDRLKQAGRYRNAADTAPTSESLALSEGDVLEGTPLGRQAARLPNVLAEDTWDLFRVLLR